jgi:DNA-binding Lrp family transcriptional regulator
MNHLTVIDKKMARLLQKDMDVSSFPFEVIGKCCDMTGIEALNVLKQMIRKGFIRRFGALLRHQKAGYTNNALVLWAIPLNKIEDIAQIFIASSFVSHCYERNPAFENKYNLFTMFHSPEDDIAALIKKMAENAGIKDYLILDSVEEFKKTSPEYFS